MFFRIIFILLAYSYSYAETKVLFLGDSLTAGYGLSLEEAFPALVETLSEGQISAINAGISGDTTAGGVGRISWLLKKHNPDIVFTALGANDGLRGFPVKLIEENLKKIISAVRGHNSDTKIILAGVRMPPTMGEAYTKDFREVFEKVAKSEGVVFHKQLLREVAGAEELNQPDGIHPTAKGQEIIAAAVWETLSSHFK